MVSGLVAAGGLVALIYLLRQLASMLSAADVGTLVSQHGPTVFGLPVAALVALCLVALMRTLDGRSRFELLGFKAEGASASSVLWIAAFLAITLSIRVLW
jgi:hypothetical protein